MEIYFKMNFQLSRMSNKITSFFSRSFGQSSETASNSNELAEISGDEEVDSNDDDELDHQVTKNEEKPLNKPNVHKIAPGLNRVQCGF